MDHRPPEYGYYGGDSQGQGPPYGYQGQSYSQDSWNQAQQQRPGETWHHQQSNESWGYNNTSPPSSGPNGGNRPYYSEQQRYSGPPQDYRGQDSSPGQYQAYPPPQPYPPYDQGYNQQPPPHSPNYGEPYPPSQPPYGYSQDESFQSPQGPPPQVLPPGAAPPPGPEEERGLMGALAGGAVGAYGGHKMGHHGFIGGIAGAYAGHKLEDSYKDHRKHGKSHSRRSSSSSSSSDDSKHHLSKPALAAGGAAALGGAAYHHQQQQQQQQHHGGGGGAPAGNFSSSSRQISLDGDYDLIAECSAVDGSHKLSSIALNSVLTNDDGHFRWGGGNFAASARNIRLADGGRFLEGELRARDGGWRHSRVWLDEKITNNNGNLQLV